MTPAFIYIWGVCEQYSCSYLKYKTKMTRKNVKKAEDYQKYGINDRTIRQFCVDGESESEYYY